MVADDKRHETSMTVGHQHLEVVTAPSLQVLTLTGGRGGGD